MTPPITSLLHLDERKLPAEVYERLAARNGIMSKADWQRKSDEARENFGKPGRDPTAFASVLGAIAGRGGWTPQLKLAQLRNHWDQVVGPAIAMHSTVAGFRDGILTIRTESAVWATQLTYMIPQLTATIRERLAGLSIEEIRVTGPQSGYQRGGSRGYRSGRR